MDPMRIEDKMNLARWPNVYKLRGHVGSCRCNPVERGVDLKDARSLKNRSPTWDDVCFLMFLRWGEVYNDLIVIAVSGSIHDMNLPWKTPWIWGKLVILDHLGQFMDFHIPNELTPWSIACHPFHAFPAEGVFAGRWSDPFIPFFPCEMKESIIYN